MASNAKKRRRKERNRQRRKDKWDIKRALVDLTPGSREGRRFVMKELKRRQTYEGKHLFQIQQTIVPEELKYSPEYMFGP